ncbi:DUF1772 domain-containing protein [Aspergillus undulatus]|uniref:DUF1772 domain-containing protein n=1 Tax=Aspergillus undulatus TaxID=1810928 RepID=UPI003CCCA533
MGGQSITKALEASAILTGSLLSGSMMTISLLAIPVFFETTTTSSQLFHQWVRMFHYGHRAHPTMAAIAFTLYTYTAWRRSIENKPWGTWLLAGLVTTLMTPFTWMFMLPTNSRIYGFAMAGKDNLGVTIGEAKRLVGRWGWMHLVRSVFPLIGAAIGIHQVLGG